MASIKKIEDLIAWQKARVLANTIWNLTKKEPFSKDFSLTDQIRISSGSVMDNIAEGFERGGNKEFIQFLYYAKGSSGEVRSQLYRTFDRGYIDQSTFDKLYTQTNELSKLISGLINYLQDSNIKGEKFKENDFKL
jgi:four helix bundle protein